LASHVRIPGGICSYRWVGKDAEGTPDQIERLYREQGKRLWWAVLAFSTDREIANDAVAEAFAQAIGRIAELRDPARWIWKAAFNIARGELKRRGAQPLEERDAAYEMPEPRGVVLALAQLSPKQRAAVVLHHYAGYSLREISMILGSAPATVGVHLTRGRRRLRRLLEEEEDA
jgi:RNA polymerase sigma-70 factor (ECF subfamily)